ncbi:MAG: capsular biosynthesis protein [Acidobacteria bacterium]|nr:MAG: capsular biosynthesis protein [Acidobacteriota bacterium]
MKILGWSLLLFSLSACMAQAPSPTSQAQPQSQSADPDLERLIPQLQRAHQALNDWPNLGRYRDANASTPPPASGENRIVFMGDSITDGWGKGKAQFFPGKPYINRGISGQTTPQMLVRFRPDVIDLKPKLVVTLAGINDIAGNTGSETLQNIEDNLSSMSELARANGIRVVIASVMPVCDYLKPQTQRRPPQQIVALNEWIKAYTAKNGFGYLDYYSATVDNSGMFRKELTYDCLHPNDAAYEVMQPLAEQAIAEALKK